MEQKDPSQLACNNDGGDDERKEKKPIHRQTAQLKSFKYTKVNMALVSTIRL
jgi:hypothetical protein